MTAFFELNKKRIHSLHKSTFDEDLYYNEVSKYYVWHNESQSWEKRERFFKSNITLNRLNLVPIQDTERYYLRMLLHQKPNPISFEDLRIYKNHTYDTYQETCSAKGLLDTDEQWENTIKEGIMNLPPKAVRSIFAYILAYSFPSSPLKLWKNNKEDLCFDFIHDLNIPFNTYIEQLGLKDIDKNLQKFQKSLKEYPLMPQIKDTVVIENSSVEASPINNTILNKEFYKERYENAYNNAVEKQKIFLRDVSRIIIQPKLYRNKCIFLNAAAGCGKTFCLDAIIDKCKSEYGEKSVIVVSSTAISAQQFKNEAKTAHSTFKFPVHFTDPRQITCNLALNSKEAIEMKDTKLIVWDEIVTIRKEFINALNNFFKDLLSTKEHFGGKIFVIAGDIGQTLPKFKESSSKAKVLCSLFCNLPLFKSFRKYTLTENLRLSLHKKDNNKKRFHDYEEFLLKIRNGTFEHDIHNKVELPKYIQKHKKLAYLIESVYCRYFEELNDEDFSHRAIVTPMNKNVSKLNDYILDSYIRGEEKVYFSFDSEEKMSIKSEHLLLPIEVLNNLNPPGFPKHSLHLKKGAIVMCLRNLSVGLANGTKMKIIEMLENIIVCKVLTGLNKNYIEYLPRITLSKTLKTESTQLIRKQFPINLACALTIDKLQGQSLKRVGLYLCYECFAHGQLYTALSRATDPNSLFIFLGVEGQEKVTTDIVWKEVFDAR